MTPSRRRWSIGLGLLAVPALLLGLAALVLREMPPISDTVAMAQSFTDFAVIITGGSVLLLIMIGVVRRTRSRRPWVTVAALVIAISLSATQLAWVAPAMIPDRRAAGATTVSVLAVNVWIGQADTRSVERAAADVDLVVLTETTQDFPWRCRRQSGQTASRTPLRVCYRAAQQRAERGSSPATP